MKLAVFAIVASSAAAFTAPTMTFAVGKKSPPKKASKTVAVKKEAPKPAAKKAAASFFGAAKKAEPVKAVKKAEKAVKKAAPVKAVAKAVAKAPVKKVAPKPKVSSFSPPKAKSSGSISGTVPSRAIPGELAPAVLDGSLVGDVGFDPCYLTTKSDLMNDYFNRIFGGNCPQDGLTWYREAELIHGRICMLAWLGFIAPGFGTIAFGYTNPLEALEKVPSASLAQIFAFMSALELRRCSIILKDGSGYVAGDMQKWGQGEGRWNPFNLNYTPEQYEEKQLQELKNGRLAMIGFLGVVFQANASGLSVVDQLSAAFVTPDYVAKTGYFFPEGI